MDIDYWSPEETHKVMELRAQGMTFPKIAKLVGRSANACRHRCRRGPESRPQATWDSASTAELVALRKSGMSFPEIARRLGRKEKSCQDRYKRATGTVAKKNKKKMKAGRVERRCLRCRDDFATTENYRLCNSCRETVTNNAHLYGVAA